MKYNELRTSVYRGRLFFLLMTYLFTCSSFLYAEGPQSLSKSLGAVNELEAIGIADLWYTMELNSGYLKIYETERIERLNGIWKHTVLYLVSRDELLEVPPVEESVLAYIVTYSPSGYVMVAGSDRIQPIIAFNATGDFRWEDPDKNAVTRFLGDVIVRRWENMETHVHPRWRHLRSKLQKSKGLDEVTFDDSDESIYVHWETATWGQEEPYWEVVIAQNGNTPGIPTGCSATAMAIKMRFHEWPVTGNNSHSYDDVWGTVQYSHAVNFGAQTYHWTNMPETNLTTSNLDVANLMYHCGVAIDMNYEVGGSGGWPALEDIREYFRYWGGMYIYALDFLFDIDIQFQTDLDSGIVSEDLRQVFEDEGYPLSQNVTVIKKGNGQYAITDAGNGREYVGAPVPAENKISIHRREEQKQDEPTKVSIRGGLPVICASTSHTMVIDGYRDTEYPFFHVNHGHGGPWNDWYDLFLGSDIENIWPYCSPENYIYVDPNWAGNENGHLIAPYNTFSEGLSAVPTDGHLWIKAGTYSGAPITLDKAMTVRSYEGMAIIGIP